MTGVAVMVRAHSTPGVGTLCACINEVCVDEVFCAQLVSNYRKVPFPVSLIMMFLFYLHCLTGSTSYDESLY